MTSAIDTLDENEIVDPSEGPCTEDEARALVREAAEAAVRFEDAMRTIFRRKAWEPLGYKNPQDLILGEFKDGGLVNPRTGKPYGRAHIYRMARTALFLHEVASRTGVDATELDIAEKALRAARENKVDDVTMLAHIEERVITASEDGDAPDAAAVQGIVDDVIAEASGRTPAAAADPDVVDDSEPAAAATGTPNTAAPTDPPVGPSAVNGDDTTDWPNEDPHRERKDPEPDFNPDDPFGAFGDQKAGSMAPEDGITWADAVAGADDFVRFTDVLRRINDIGGMLPEIGRVKEKLPEFLDSCDDSELNAFSEALDDVDLVVAELPKIREAIRAIQECAQERAEDM